MPLTKQGYRTRIIDARINELLKVFGAISIEGPKWCGKTWTMLNHCESVYYVGDPAQNYQNRNLALMDPSRVLKGDKPHAIDEWQEAPGIWDAVRFEVDQNKGRGQFILTGSVKPPKIAVSHSGVGRIAKLQMRPMTLFESGESTGELSFTQLVTGGLGLPSHVGATVLCDAAATIDDIAYYVTRGGWPDSIGLASEYATEFPLQYIRETAQTDISQVDSTQRDPIKVGALLRSLARNNQTMVGYSTLIRDIKDNEEKGISVTEPTLASYLEALIRLHVIEEIPAWNPNMRSSKRIRVSPKRHFVDPSLAVAALGANQIKLIGDLQTFGFMFETLVARDIKVFADALNAQVFHYRDDSDLEVDLIIELPDASWSAFEIKLGAIQIDEAAASLIRLKEKVKSRGAKEPSCLAVICGVIGSGYIRKDGVIVIPVTTLGF